ncbi:hypothetical protein ACFVAJ_16545 [Agromyces sp. NPDC057679]|uniref:hypothetical protein n=1 Tax=Agromyces sp. NPDC057679 TaxID=3346207 RepID=UPI00366B1E29
MQQNVVTAARIVTANVSSGPWQVVFADGPDGRRTVGLAGPENDVFDGVNRVDDLCEMKERDAKFIADARTLLPLLVYEVDRRDAEIARLRRQVENLTAQQPSAPAERPLRLVS